MFVLVAAAGAAPIDVRLIVISTSRWLLPVVV
jgi:hypothetical protein